MRKAKLCLAVGLLTAASTSWAVTPGPGPITAEPTEESKPDIVTPPPNTPPLTVTSTPSPTPVLPQAYTLMPYITVSTSPYVGQNTAYDASDIWSQQSTMNEDLFLLQYKEGFEEALEKVGASLNQRPILEISGAIEGAASQEFNDWASNPDGSLSLNTAELDFHAMASRWATAFMSIEFDSSPPDFGSRVTNSRLYLSRGFATIGDLSQFPVYFTVGQFYLPFGRYASYMVTAPLTLSLGRINDRAMLLGFYEHGFYASAYAYNGTRSNGGDSVIKAGGANLGFKKAFTDDFNIGLGTGVVSNLGDSQGMGYTGDTSPEFPGFTNISSGSSTYPFVHNVPGIDGHLEIGYGQWELVGEYLAATESFDEQDMTFNCEGAAPSAMSVELWRTVKIINRDYMFGVSYGHSWQALALNLPAQSFDGYIRTSFWKNTIEALEFRHDIDYGDDDVATAAEGFGPNGPEFTFNNYGTGKTRNMLLAQLGVYF